MFKGRAAVYEAGRERKRTILLVHGLGANGAADFAEHAAWLARSYHVLAVDLPGFAQSDKAAAAYSPATYAAFLKHVVERFARKPVALLGHSMGAVVALRYAANYPEDVERLVVVDAPGILHRAAYAGDFLSRLGLGFLQPGSGGSPAAGGEPLGMLIERLHQILGRAEQTGLDPQLVLSIPLLREKLLQNDPLKIAGLAVGLEDLSRELPQIRTETLVIWGAQDAIAPLRTGKLLAHVLPRAQLAVIERAGHTPMQEEPARFRELLEPFLAQGLAPAPAKAEPAPRRGNAQCDRQSGLLYEGDYGLLVLQGCRNIRLRAARVRELRVLDSSVSIEDSDIGGDSAGLTAGNAAVTMTNGRIRGPVAITLRASRLDLAGVRVEGRDAAVLGQDVGPAPASSVVFSVSRVRSPHTDGAMHGYMVVVSGKPL